MHPRTVATIEDLMQADWFCNVGVHDTTDAIVLSSWKEAVESCSSLEWENLCLEAANQYRMRLRERDPHRWREWNAVVDRVRPVADEISTNKTRKVIQENRLPKRFLDMVRWDITGLLMESEYADVYPPGFYASQAYWYVAGHFPCGWRGQFPNGILVVY